MIYTRDVKTNSILSKIDLDLVTLSSADQTLMLQKRIAYLNDTSKGTTPIIEIPAGYLVGFGEQQNEYYIECNTPRIAVFVKGKQGLTQFCWYTEKGDEIELLAQVAQDSIVYLQVQGNRVVYDDKIVYLRCKNIPKHKQVKLYFQDCFGLPQSTQMVLGSYGFVAEPTDSFRAYNDELNYPIHKVPATSIVIADNGIPNKLKMFCNGIVSSECYLVDINRNGAKECTISDQSLTANFYNKSLQYSATLTIRTLDI